MAPLLPVPLRRKMMRELSVKIMRTPWLDVLAWFVGSTYSKSSILATLYPLEKLTVMISQKKKQTLGPIGTQDQQFAVSAV